VEYACSHRTHSSAKDQLTASPVAIKKIMKPFSTPVLSKRTYRELKLLKHLRHENVRIVHPFLDKESFF
jgi:serine/threonine protein kinase